MNNRTPLQTLLLIIGVIVCLGGIVCVVMGFADFAGSDVTEDTSGSFMLFAAGGFAMVVGFGIFAFTRAAILTRNGGYRITIEQGGGAATGKSCASCGKPISPSARFCESCGAVIG
jgi:hypothetical protein